MNDGGLEKESSHENENSKEGGGARHFLLLLVLVFDYILLTQILSFE